MEINDLSSGQYSSNKNIRFKTSMPRSNLSDCSDVYIAVKGTIYLFTATAKENDKAQKNFTFKIMLHLDHVFKKITLTENAEDLDMVMPIYNLLDYNQNYSVTSGSL